MVANRIWILIGKKLSGEATPQEMEELKGLVADSGDSVNSIGEFEQMLLTVNIESTHKSDEEIAERWEQFKHKLDPEPKVIPIKQNNKRRSFWLVAASVLVVCSVTLALIARSSVNYRLGLLTTIAAPTGAPKKIILPDGSKVWLNAKSKLIYGKHFGVKREVTLVGEAFFDVVKDANHPFVVSTASLRLKVLGTAFNVRAFAN
jgi:transmembrane sensor